MSDWDIGFLHRASIESFAPTFLFQHKCSYHTPSNQLYVVLSCHSKRLWAYAFQLPTHWWERKE